MKKIFLLFAISVSILLILPGCGTRYPDGGVFENSKELVASVKSDVSEITHEELRKLMEDCELRVLIDVREPASFEEGYINMPDEEDEYPFPETYTVNIPRGLIEFKIGSADYWDNDLWVEMPAKDELIVVYCQTGGRSALAVHAMQQLGYTNVHSLQGGYRIWLDPSLPLEETESDSGG